MHNVIISLASNYEQAKHLTEARTLLGRVLCDLRYTPEIWTEPIGGKTSTLYLNQLATATTTLTPQQLTATLKDIERTMHRTEFDRQRNIVRIDLDLLLYDKQRHHVADWDRPYVKQLLPLLEQP